MNLARCSSASFLFASLLASLAACAPAAAPTATSDPSAAAKLTSSAPSPTTPTPARALLALSKAKHTLAIVDPTSLKVIATVPVGSDPHEVIATADGATAYVSITGGGKSHEIDVIDLVGQRALPELDTGALIGPHGLAQAGGKIWFTAEGAKAVARIDPSTNKIDAILGTGQNRTHMVYVTNDQKQVYTTNVDSATVTLMESVMVQPMGPPPGALPPGQGNGPGPEHMGPPPGPRQDWNETVLPAGKGSEGFDVSPDGRELWTAAAQDGTITVIDIAGKKVDATIDAKVLGANRLKFTPDGAYALVSSLRSGELTVLDAHTRKEVKRVPIGHGAAGILVDGDGARAFIGCTADDYVAVVDLKKLEVTGHIDVGGKPDGLTWAVRR